MWKIIRSKTNTIIKKFGYKAVKLNFMNDLEYSIKKILLDMEIDLVMDIGAYQGGFSMFILKNRLAKQVFAIEPNQNTYPTLDGICKKYKNFNFCTGVAASDKIGKTTLNISANGESSSLRNMSSIHLKAEPNSYTMDRQDIETKTLDAIIKDSYPYFDGNIFLKIDVQGFELNVLNGAASILDSTNAILIELSTEELYHGQSGDVSIRKYLEIRGYNLWGIWPVFVDQQSGKLLQYDALFIKK